MPGRIDRCRQKRVAQKKRAARWLPLVPLRLTDQLLLNIPIADVVGNDFIQDRMGVFERGDGSYLTLFESVNGADAIVADFHGTSTSCT